MYAGIPGGEGIEVRMGATVAFLVKKVEIMGWDSDMMELPVIGIVMKILKLITSFLLISQIIYSQEGKLLKGRIIVDNEPLIGQSIMVYNTLNGTVSQLNGEFELKVERYKEVLLELSQCFQNGYFIVDSTMDFVEIKLDSKFIRKSKKTFKKWKRKNAEKKRTDKRNNL